MANGHGRVTEPVSLSLDLDSYGSYGDDPYGSQRSFHENLQLKTHYSKNQDFIHEFQVSTEIRDKWEGLRTTQEWVRGAGEGARGTVGPIDVRMCVPLLLAIQSVQKHLIIQLRRISM